MYDGYDIADEAGLGGLSGYITQTENYEACREHMASMLK